MAACAIADMPPEACHFGPESKDKAPKRLLQDHHASRFPTTSCWNAAAMEMLPDNKLAVGTRRGDIYVVEGVYDENPSRT